MSGFDSYSREQLRQAYSEAWRKHLQGVPLSALEGMLVDVIGVHPEYQSAIRDPLHAAGLPVPVAAGAENPFLHMGLHMAVREQLSIDRPPGIRELCQSLEKRHGDGHRAEHALMEALGETLWEAQRSGRPPDEAHYFALARRGLDIT